MPIQNNPNNPIMLKNPAGPLQFSGSILGQDWKKVSEQVLAPETKKIDTLKKTIESQKAQTKALQDLSLKLADLQKISNTLSGDHQSSQGQSVFDMKSVNTSPNAQQSFGVQLSSDAMLGSYQISVQQLATAYKMRSDVQVSRQDALGLQGTLVFATSQDGTQNPLTVSIQSSDTLSTIAQSINHTSSPFSASIIQVSTHEFYLNVSHKKTGEPIYIGGGSTDSVVLGLGLGTSSQPHTYTVKHVIQQAQPAIVQIDGQSLIRPTNVISDALQGVTFDLYAVTTGTASMTVDHDLSQVKETLHAFVDAYNGVREFMNTQQLSSDSPLYRSEVLQTIDSKLYSMLNASSSEAGQTLKTLSSIGINISYAGIGNKDVTSGKLQIDDSILNTQILGQLNQIKSLLSFSWDISHPQLEPLLVPDVLPALSHPVSLDITMTGQDITSVTCSEGWEVTVEGRNLTFASGPMKGVVLGYQGHGSASNIQIMYQKGLVYQFSETLKEWTNPETGFLQGVTDQELKESQKMSQKLQELESAYDKKLQEKIKKYTEMEVKYAKVQQVLESVKQMQQSWFSSK